MNSNKLTSFKTIISITLILVLASVAYYFYSIQHIPQKVAQSQETIINVDRIRFTFKVSIMAQRSYTTYLNAIEFQNQDKLYDAMDYLDAAFAFTDIAYTKNSQFSEQSRKLLKEVSEQYKQNGLTKNAELAASIGLKIDMVSKYAEQVERMTWQDVQNNYINFKTQEYKVFQLYQSLTFAISIFLLISIWFGFRQNTLIQQNRKQRK